MSLTERVTQIRELQRKAEKKASKEVVKVSKAATEVQERARAANLGAFNKFEQGLGLRKSLEALAEAEGLESPKIHELIKEPVAALVELRLEWQGRPKRKYQEGVMTTPPRGFFSISIKWSVDGSVIVSGENVQAAFTPFLDNVEYREDFKESIAEAYLNPRWNEEHVQIMLAGEKPAHDLESWPQELRD